MDAVSLRKERNLTLSNIKSVYLTLCQTLSFINKDVKCLICGYFHTLSAHCSIVLVDAMLHNWDRIKHGSQNMTCQMCILNEQAGWFCKNCGQFIGHLCKTNIHSTIKLYQHHDFVDLNSNRGLPCSVMDFAPKPDCTVDDRHKLFKLEYFCDQCEVMICQQCHQPHKKMGHRVNNLSTLDELSGMLFRILQKCTSDEMNQSLQNFKVLINRFLQTVQSGNDLDNENCLQLLKEISRIKHNYLNLSEETSAKRTFSCENSTTETCLVVQPWDETQTRLHNSFQEDIEKNLDINLDSYIDLHGNQEAEANEETI